MVNRYQTLVGAPATSENRKRVSSHVALLRPNASHASQDRQGFSSCREESHRLRWWRRGCPTGSHCDDVARKGPPQLRTTRTGWARWPRSVRRQAGQDCSLTVTENTTDAPASGHARVSCIASRPGRDFSQRAGPPSAPGCRRARPGMLHRHTTGGAVNRSNHYRTHNALTPRFHWASWRLSLLRSTTYGHRRPCNSSQVGRKSPIRVPGRHSVSLGI